VTSHRLSGNDSLRARFMHRNGSGKLVHSDTVLRKELE
jgi:hypothetical protein